MLQKSMQNDREREHGNELIVPQQIIEYQKSMTLMKNQCSKGNRECYMQINLYILRMMLFVINNKLSLLQMEALNFTKFVQKSSNRMRNQCLSYQPSKKLFHMHFNLLTLFITTCFSLPSFYRRKNILSLPVPIPQQQMSSPQLTQDNLNMMDMTVPLTTSTSSQPKKRKH